MRKLTAAGAVLLLASLLLNAVLLSRGRPEAAPGRDTVRAPESQARAMEQLASERERNSALSARIRELESGRAAARPDGASASLPEDRKSRFRERFRRYVLLSADENAGEDPESQLAMSEAGMDYRRAEVGRGKDPATYAECMKELFDAALQDKKLELSADQLKALRPIMDDFREALVRASPASVMERSLLDLQGEAAAMKRAIALLSEAQYQRLASTLSGLGLYCPGTQYYLGGEGVEDTIVERWSSMYQLEETQQPAAREAVRNLASTLRQIAEKTRGKAFNDRSADDYDVRLRTQEVQVAALKLLENVMTPAQVERMRSIPLTGFHLQYSEAFGTEK
jgi:hypothetical protein